MDLSPFSALPGEDVKLSPLTFPLTSLKGGL